MGPKMLFNKRMTHDYGRRCELASVINTGQAPHQLQLTILWGLEVPGQARAGGLQGGCAGGGVDTPHSAPIGSGGFHSGGSGFGRRFRGLSGRFHMMGFFSSAFSCGQLSASCPWPSQFQQTLGWVEGCECPGARARSFG